MQEHSAIGNKIISKGGHKFLEEKGVYYIKIHNRSNLSVTIRDDKFSFDLAANDYKIYPGFPESPFNININIEFLTAADETDFVEIDYMRAYDTTKK